MELCIYLNFVRKFNVNWLTIVLIILLRYFGFGIEKPYRITIKKTVKYPSELHCIFCVLLFCIMLQRIFYFSVSCNGVWFIFLYNVTVYKNVGLLQCNSTFTECSTKIGVACGWVQYFMRSYLYTWSTKMGVARW